MHKFLTVWFLFLIVCFPVLAQENNIFGIHLAVPNKEDLQAAADLVNSNGGKWGYVTLVIQENDRDVNKWQGVFDQLRGLKLVPIIRLATVPEGASWKKPNRDDTGGWVDFLNKLNWVVKERYIVLFNEPNHGNEWGGVVDPEDVAQTISQYAKALKEKNPNFFVMAAGLDAAAPSASPQYEDEAIFLKKMIEKEPHIFDYLDGLSSHSYPNPGFSGSPYASGRNSILNYEWELSYLKSLGVTKDLPVFITETGWVRRGSSADDFKTAFENWADDPRVMAVTPFILNYQTEPFLQFSWQKKDSKDFYPQYYAVKDLKKRRGSPEQIERGEVIANLPHSLLVDSNYHFQFRLKNTGQSIWDKKDNYELRMINDDGVEIPEYFFSNIHEIKPYTDDVIDIYLKLGEKPIAQNVRIALFKNGKELPVYYDWDFNVIPLPRLVSEVNLFPRIRQKAERKFEIQIFDEREQLVYKKSGLKRIKNTITVDAIHNIYIGGKYRVVVLSDLYLPRQTHVTFREGQNRAKFKAMLPLDLNKNGRLDWGDAASLLQNPLRLGLFLP